MRLLSLFACYLLLWSCATPPPATETAGQTPRAPIEREITISSVVAGNPVVVEGNARTFENNVAIRLLDARGALIRETFTTSRGETGRHNPFSTEVFITRDPGGRLTVEALEYSARDGSERSLTSKTIDYAVEPIAVELYLPDTARSPTDCSRVFPERHYLPKSISMARLLVEALIAAPGSPFPRGSAVESVILRDGVLTVDFNERLQNVGGSCAALAIRAAVQQTLRRLPTVERVIITAVGSEKLALQP